MGKTVGGLGWKHAMLLVSELSATLALASIDIVQPLASSPVWSGLLSMSYCSAIAVFRIVGASGVIFLD